MFKKNNILYKVGGLIYKHTDPLSSLDIAAKVLVVNGQITESAIWLKIDTLVKALKADGTYSKFKAIWLLRGGKPLSAKLNLLNPQSTNNGYRLEFRNNTNSNVPVYASDGVNFTFRSFARTFFVPSDHLTNDNFTMGFYRKNDIASSGTDFGSVANSSANRFFLAARKNDTCEMSFGNVTFSVANTNAIGAYLGTKTPGTNARIYKNTTQIANTSTAATVILPNNECALSAINVNNSGNGDGSPVTGHYGYAFVGLGLTDAEALLVQQRFIAFMS